MSSIYLNVVLKVTASVFFFWTNSAADEYKRFVGCYRFKNNMDKFSNYTEQTKFPNNSEKAAFSLTHRCTQICLSQDLNYAGLMEHFRCYCGDTYNQTFAVDQEICNCGETVCPGLMRIYNTDYDMKPLLSVPGNNSNIFEVWETDTAGKFDGIFLDDIMRNPAIDWWNEGRLYHTPEYVTLFTMNKYGQRLFSMDFFTNGSKADLKSWMKPINILSSEWINSVNDIFIGRDILTIHNEMHSVLFFHGDLLKFGSSSRVTVFTPNKQPQPVFTSVYWGIRIMEDIDNKNICRTECTVQTGFIFKNDVQGDKCYCIISYDQQHNSSLRQIPSFWDDSHFPLACPMENVLSNQALCYADCTGFHFMMYNITDGTCLCFDKDTEDKCNITLFIEPNYRHPEMKLVNYSMESITVSLKNFQHSIYVCGVQSFGWTGCPEQPQQLRLTIWITEKWVHTVPINWLDRHHPLYFDDCIYTHKTKLEILGLDCERNFSLHYSLLIMKEQSLLIADRMVILGYYHKEEPKVSKWEFLNNFTYEEIQNIMRPVLENTKTEGKVPVRNLSSSIRKKESAPDDRKSSQGIGILGGFLLGFTLIIIFISDVMILRVHLAAMCQNLYRLFKIPPKKSRIKGRNQILN